MRRRCCWRGWGWSQAASGHRLGQGRLRVSGSPPGHVSLPGDVSPPGLQSKDHEKTLCCPPAAVDQLPPLPPDSFCRGLSQRSRRRKNNSASKRSIRRFVITEKAPTRAFSWLKAAITAFTFKTLLRHYAKRTLTPQSLNVKLGPRRKGHKGRAVWLA